jgi:hypothetical protein
MGETLDDLLNRRGALRALVEMRKIEPKSMTAAMLQRASGYSAGPNAELRDDLESWGLVVSEMRIHERSVIIESRLTPAGRVVADRALEVEKAGLAAREKHAKRR